MLKATGGRFVINLISSVSPRGDFRLLVLKRTVTAVMFMRFLQRWMDAAERPICLIVDGHSVHKAKLVREYVKSTQGV